MVLSMGPSAIAAKVALLATLLISAEALSIAPRAPGLNVRISVADGLLNSSTDGRISLLFAPAGLDPLDDTDVTSSPDLFFGKNVYNYHSRDTAVLTGDSGQNVRIGVYGYPNVSLNDVAPGDYTVQAYLNIYEKAVRSDGSVVSVRFPCGDGQPNVAGFGSLITPMTNVTISGGHQTISLHFNDSVPYEVFNGTEIGACRQGNYVDSKNLKHVKIRSAALSKFWNRDMYVGANILLPAGYQANDTNTRYPVVYSQNHWAGGDGAFRYSTSASFAATWDSGVINGTNTTAARPTPKFIVISFRHEAPYYDDSYAVNTANFGPYGDALNDELVPHLDAMFNTIGKPYARIQEGGSTGGWESIASVIYRPDLFGSCFTYYPDSLDFRRHQDIYLYNTPNAYYREGVAVPSIRTVTNGTEIVEATTEMENHWELTFGTSSRSALQWDAWQAVFGAQGLNGYPLEAWNKVTGEIYPEAVEYWKPFDLSHYVTGNWDNAKNLGAVLKNRIFIYVGLADTYYLNEGVEKFQENVESFGGAGWANFTYIAGAPHGGNYNRLEIWTYLELLDKWFKDHAPGGATPLGDNVTSVASRGNYWEETIARAGHQAALTRQASPHLDVYKKLIKGSVGRWDPGVALTAQWKVDGRLQGKSFAVKQGQTVPYEVKGHLGWWKRSFQLLVTGTKNGYVDETRASQIVKA
ncbi:hypothetical protein B0A48_04506 [Cryoendolithus antarcticus]|uniref:Uncharacterized protein n=1 Tax=Cryoendolithus antarcticus TaxID=1507870 RepID=A0A1V8TFJ5_9PEZI|nr:hypothetical protein B0A48_04506 [Cryoendolithus antarcticus]